MKNFIYILLIVFLILNQNNIAFSKVFNVRTLSSFNNALNIAQKGDTIFWENGTYNNIYMQINKDDIVVAAESPGKVIFSGKSRISLKGNQITFSGFQYLNGDIGTNSVLVSDGNNNRISQINIKDYNCTKYLVINAQCERNEVSYCNFEHRMNTWDKNILSILVDANKPGYHVVRYCSFRNFEGTGGDMGVEPIRIGLSSQGEFISRSVVEYCYFTQCNGDGEIISNKARQNVFRYNTFEDNPKGELVLRHGDEGVVYGNFFLNGMGGVRIKEGQHHVVFNNYFAGIKRYPINLQNYSVDPLDSITIAFNTIVNCQNSRLGKAGDYPPQNVTFANNIFYNNQSEKLFIDVTGTENWIGNISHGTPGFARPNGIKEADPLFSLNKEGFYELSDGSPAIDAAQPGYPNLPDYEGMGIDHEVMFDLVKNERPADIFLKDLGCIEFSSDSILKPHATAKNTGPFYLHTTDTVFSERPEVTGSARIVDNIDDFVEASSNMEGTIYLVKYGLNVATQGKLDSLVMANQGRRAVAPVADSTIRIYTKGLPGDYYQYYSVSSDSIVSNPSKVYVIVEEKGPVLKIKNDISKSSLFAYYSNKTLVIEPGNNEKYKLEIFNKEGRLLYKKQQLFGKQYISLNNSKGLMIARKSTGVKTEILKIVSP